MAKKISGFAITLLVACLIIFSACSKLDPDEYTAEQVNDYNNFLETLGGFSGEIVSCIETLETLERKYKATEYFAIGNNYYESVENQTGDIRIILEKIGDCQIKAKVLLKFLESEKDMYRETQIYLEKKQTEVNNPDLIFLIELDYYEVLVGTEEVLIHLDNLEAEYLSILAIYN